MKRVITMFHIAKRHDDELAKKKQYPSVILRAIWTIFIKFKFFGRRRNCGQNSSHAPGASADICSRRSAISGW